MPDHTPDSSLRIVPVPRGFIVYASVTLVAALLLLGLAWAAPWEITNQARFWMLALFVLVGELLPIPVPRRHGLDKITISTRSRSRCCCASARRPRWSSMRPAR